VVTQVQWVLQLVEKLVLVLVLLPVLLLVQATWEMMQAQLEWLVPMLVQWPLAEL
jgi:hypothetical protein